jgi:hypothetical protein
LACAARSAGLLLAASCTQASQLNTVGEAAETGSVIDTNRTGTSHHGVIAFTLLPVLKIPSALMVRA